MKHQKKHPVGQAIVDDSISPSTAYVAPNEILLTDNYDPYLTAITEAPDPEKATKPAPSLLRRIIHQLVSW